MIPAKPHRVLYPVLAGICCLIPLVLQLLLARRQNPFWGVLAGTAGLILIVAWIGTRLNASLVMK
ncbi:MAG: hypothetical protein IJR36_05970, partial [Lachnospiraceae bacterium]|nr:hypothetical protein [Lachnospiraceae bacterium]